MPLAIGVYVQLKRIGRQGHQRENGPTMGTPDGAGCANWESLQQCMGA